MNIEEILMKIKHASSMKELDDMRIECFLSNSNEVLKAWQRKYKGKKAFRNKVDVGYRFDYNSVGEQCHNLKSRKY